MCGNSTASIASFTTKGMRGTSSPSRSTANESGMSSLSKPADIPLLKIPLNCLNCFEDFSRAAIAATADSSDQLCSEADNFAVASMCSIRRAAASFLTSCSAFFACLQFFRTVSAGCHSCSSTEILTSAANLSSRSKFVFRLVNSRTRKFQYNNRLPARPSSGDHGNRPLRLEGHFVSLAALPCSKRLSIVSHSSTCAVVHTPLSDLL